MPLLFYKLRKNNKQTKVMLVIYCHIFVYLIRYNKYCVDNTIKLPLHRVNWLFVIGSCASKQIQFYDNSSNFKFVASYILYRQKEDNGFAPKKPKKKKNKPLIRLIFFKNSPNLRDKPNNQKLSALDMLLYHTYP